MKYLNIKTTLTAACLIGTLQYDASAKITLHTIGDSTMATHDATDEIHGWGQMFQQFFDAENVTVNNRSKSGASSKSFYLESPYWTSVKTQIKQGDYVLIQFGHNDEKTTGMDGDELKALYQNCGKSAVANATDYRGTTASNTYKEYLRRYINETRALGATPILATPMCRNYWSGSSITNTGQHNLCDKFWIWDAANDTVKVSSTSTSDHTYDYPYAMKEIAQELNVPLLDITNQTKALYESYGQSNTTRLLFCSSDGTHPNSLGGTMVARLAAQDLKSKGILADFIQADADLLINPSNLDFGSAYLGQTITREITISGFDLEQQEGIVAVTAADGFLISTDKTNFSQNLNLNYSGGNLSCATVYVRCTFASLGAFTSKLTVTCGTKTKTVNISGECIQMAEGTEVLLSWALNADAQYQLTGPATAIDQSWNEMSVQKYSAPNSNTTWPEGSGYTSAEKTQRNMIGTDGLWPATDIDEVSTRYIQFGITANSATVLNIDSIGFYVAGAGGNGMRCHVYYQVENEPAVAMSAADGTNMGSSMVANNMYEVSATPVIALKEGESLYVRIYPWYNGGSTSAKTLCLSHLTIHGVASTPDGIKNVTSELQVKDKVYISTDGVQTSTAPSGISIVKETLSDGSVRCRKIYEK